jgi:translin
MKDISDTVAAANARMETLEKMRERSISLSRSVIRLTKNAIHAIHSGEEHESILKRAVSEYECLYADICSESEILLSGPVGDAMMELSEACILSSIVLGKDVPSFTSMNVTPQAWVLGLADCLGELRRMLLTSLMNGDLREAKAVFGDMEIICNSVLSFDTPEAILPVRRKQDVARSVMERTRTDITNASLMKR